MLSVYAEASTTPLVAYIVRLSETYRPAPLPIYRITHSQLEVCLYDDSDIGCTVAR